MDHYEESHDEFVTFEAVVQWVTNFLAALGAVADAGISALFYIGFFK